MKFMTLFTPMLLCLSSESIIFPGGTPIAREHEIIDTLSCPLTCSNELIQLLSIPSEAKRCRLIKHRLHSCSGCSQAFLIAGSCIEDVSKIEAASLFARGYLVGSQVALSKYNVLAQKFMLDVVSRSSIVQNGFAVLKSRHAKSEKDAFNNLRLQYVRHTTAIEGNNLPLQAVRKLMEQNETESNLSILESEILGSKAALEHLLDGRYISPPSQMEILRLHQLTMQRHAIAGRLRESNVRVGDHVPPGHELIPGMMERYEHWVQSSSFNEEHPIVQAAMAHFEFVWIHPFEDGNGRTGRLISSAILLKHGFPPLVIDVNDRELYFSALGAAHPKNGGDILPLTQLFLKSMENTVRALGAAIAHDEL